VADVGMPEERLDQPRVGAFVSQGVVLSAFACRAGVGTRVNS